jgi:hypothetical protein
MLQNVFGLATSALKLGIDANRAGKQRARAAELVAESKQIKKTPLRKEFEQAKRGADMMATQGLASTFTAQKQLDADAANNLKAIQQSSPSGAVASAAIASTIADKNRASQELLARDAEFRTAGAKQALNTLWNVGEKERDLEIEQRERREALQKQALALENSALKRTEAAEGQFLKSATGAFTSLGGALGGAASNAISSNMENSAEVDAGALEGLDEGMMNAEENMEGVDPSDQNYDLYKSSVTDMEEQKKLYKEKMRKKQLNQSILQSLFR